MVVVTFWEWSSLPLTLTSTGPPPPDVPKLAELTTALPEASVVPVLIDPPGHTTRTWAPAIGAPGVGVEQLTFTVMVSECCSPGF